MTPVATCLGTNWHGHTVYVGSVEEMTTDTPEHRYCGLACRTERMSDEARVRGLVVGLYPTIDEAAAAVVAEYHQHGIDRAGKPLPR